MFLAGISEENVAQQWHCTGREFLFENSFFTITRFLNSSLALNAVYEAGIEKVPQREKLRVLTACLMIKMGIYFLHDSHCA